MIVKMFLLIYIMKSSNDKFRRNADRCIYRRKIERKTRNGSLVLLQFDHFFFIMAASVGLFSMHTTFTTDGLCCCKQLGGCKPVHAVMIINYNPATYSQVTKESYASHYLFHRQNKGNINF